MYLLDSVYVHDKNNKVERLGSAKSSVRGSQFLGDASLLFGIMMCEL